MARGSCRWAELALTAALVGSTWTAQGSQLPLGVGGWSPEATLCSFPLPAELLGFLPPSGYFFLSSWPTLVTKSLSAAEGLRHPPTPRLAQGKASCYLLSTSSAVPLIHSTQPCPDHIENSAFQECLKTLIYKHWICLFDYEE